MRMSDLKQYKQNTYSQYGEDGIVEELLKRAGLTGSLDGWWCLDIGAWDGLHLSNVQCLVEREAMAVEVESMQSRFAALEELATEWPIMAIHAAVDVANIEEILAVAYVGAGELGRPLLCSIDIDGDHAGLLGKVPWNFEIVIAEWNNRGDKSQDKPLREWAASNGYTVVCRTNSNLIMTKDGGICAQ